MGIPIETVRTDTFAMDFFRFGRGEKPLVILPGLSVQSVMGAADAVAEAYRVMEDEFTVCVFDRRAEVPAVYPVAEMARDTAAALRALGLRDVCLFGASQGGMIAMELAIGHPDLVSRLALGSTAAEMGEDRCRVLERWIRLARDGDPVGLYLDFGRAVYPPAFFEQWREPLRAAGETVTEAELARFITLTEGTLGFCASDRLDRLRCPILALGARDDAVLGPEAIEELVEKLRSRPDFSYHVYDGYGHAAFDTAPDYKDRLLRFFLQ